MSGFDDDPFDKPFSDADVFGDPSIQQVTRNTQNMQSSLEDYNPFDNEKPKPVNPTNNVAVVQTSNQNSSASVPPNQNAKSVISTDELQVIQYTFNSTLHYNQSSQVSKVIEPAPL